MSPGDPQLQRDSCLIWSPTRPDYRSLLGHSLSCTFLQNRLVEPPAALLGFEAF